MSDEEDEARRYGEVFDDDDNAFDREPDERTPDVRRVPQGCAWGLVSVLLCIGGILAWLMT